MLWFGITVLEDSRVVDQEVHGPYDDTDSLTEAVDERLEEAEAAGQLAVPFQFELCTDDVPQVVTYEAA
jgi:hypothetical protein